MWFDKTAWRGDENLRLGSQPLEEALEPFALIEFFGDWPTILDYTHYVASLNPHILLVYVQLFGGLDAHVLQGSDLYIARCFDAPSTVETLRALGENMNQDHQNGGRPFVAVVDPYLHAKSPRDRLLVTSALRRLSLKARVAVFNRASKGGTPWGGLFHASTIQVLVLLEQAGRGLRDRGRRRGLGGHRNPERTGYLATLVKHPAKPSTTRYLIKPVKPNPALLAAPTQKLWGQQGGEANANPNN